MRPAVARGAVTAATGLAAVVCAIWLWTHFCYFPWHVWNDIRLAPAIMTLAGENVYSLPGSGIVTTWIYGPVPLWLWAPAGLASDAPSALLAGGALNIAYTLLAIAAVCAWWPPPNHSQIDLRGRLCALLFCIALWPSAAWDFLASDNLTIALGLIANLLLQRNQQRSILQAWLAALFVAAAIGCKQTSGGIAVAQIMWVWLELGRREALHQSLRIVACGALLLVATIVMFDPAGAWFGMVHLPAQFPLTPSILERISLHAGLLVFHVVAPLILVIAKGRSLLFRSHPLRLPMFTWMCTLPMSLLGLFSSGGNQNAVISFLLLLPPLIVYGIAIASYRSVLRTSLALAVIAIIWIKWPHQPPRPWSPRTEHLDLGARLTKNLAGAIWFSWNPTLSHYIYGKACHVEDGLYMRGLAGVAVPLQQFSSGIPPGTRHIVVAIANWDIAPAIAGDETTPVRIAGTPWLLYSLPHALNPENGN